MGVPFRGTSTRILALGGWVLCDGLCYRRRALVAWLEVRPQDKGPWVFVGLTPKSKQVNAHTVGKMLKRRGEQAGCSGPVNPHAFRHGFARSYLSAGGDLGTLLHILGHSSVAVTVEYYAVFTTDELQRQHAKHSPVGRLERRI
jgi:site-specific recombinase XerD